MVTESIQHGVPAYLPVTHNDSKTTVSVNEVELVPEEIIPNFGHLSTPTFIDPQIHVDGHKLQLPLSEEDARLCIHVGHQSSRRTWQLNNTDFEIRSPEWPKYLNLMVEEVAKSMGLGCEKPGFHAELCNMRLYEEEAVVEKYTAAERVPGTFATMTVQLPSSHTGATVSIDGEELAQFSPSASPLASMVWWQAENSYEMSPVGSGTRWELTFNLVQDNKSRL